MSVVENNNVNAVLLQQVLNFPLRETKTKQSDKEKSSNLIADIVNLSPSALKKFPEKTILQQETSSSLLKITAQEAALQEKQNELDEKNATTKVLSVRSFILKNDEKALNQQANQSKEAITTLI